MNNKKVHIPQVNCRHCIAAINRELSEMEGIESVEGDPATKEVIIRFREPLTWESIREKLREIGYPPEE